MKPSVNIYEKFYDMKQVHANKWHDSWPYFNNLETLSIVSLFGNYSDE